MSEEDPYRPASFWEDAHNTSRDSKSSLGANIGHVGGGPSARNAEILYRLRAKAMDRLLKKCSGDALESVLELGSGAGFWADYFQKRGTRKYIGSDISKTAVDRLNERFGGCSFFCLADQPAKAWEEMGNEGPFSLTLGIDVLYHITDDELWKASLDNLCRLTRPGGYHVICDYFHDQAVETPGSVHVKHRVMQDYLDVYERHNMRVVDIQPAFFLMNRIVDGPWRDHSRLVSVLLRTAYANRLLLMGLEVVDRIWTKFARPMSPSSKTRFLLARKG